MPPLNSRDDCYAPLGVESRTSRASELCFLMMLRTFPQSLSKYALTLILSAELKAYRSAGYHDRTTNNSNSVAAFNEAVAHHDSTLILRSNWSPSKRSVCLLIFGRSTSKRRKKLIEICDYWEVAVLSNLLSFFGLTRNGQQTPDHLTELIGILDRCIFLLARRWFLAIFVVCLDHRLDHS